MTWLFVYWSRLRNDTTKTSLLGEEPPMDQEFIVNVFGSLQSLEKLLSTSKKIVLERRERPVGVASALLQQTKILIEMRRAAIKLQLYFAQKNLPEAIRFWKIYKGLHQMVYPEICEMFAALTNNPGMPREGKDGVCH